MTVLELEVAEVMRLSHRPGWKHARTGSLWLLAPIRGGAEGERPALPMGVRCPLSGVSYDTNFGHVRVFNALKFKVADDSFGL